MQGRLFSGAVIGLLIGGGAYASTVDEATFWYLKGPLFWLDAAFAIIA